MRKLIFIVLLFFASSVPAFSQAETKWNTSKSTHFIISFKTAPESFIEQVISKSEDYYDKIADNLGFTRFNFWLWDNRANIYIYDDASDYQASTGQPAWSAGAARPREKIIYTYPFAKGFFETILPHEMGHIIFREFVGFDNYAVPLWLDEGVASYQQSEKYSQAMPFVKQAVISGSFMPLDQLAATNPKTLSDQNTVQLFYAESICVVDYLIKEFGKDNFVIFCQNLRDKKDLERAICSVYPFSDLEEFGQAWQRYIKKQ